MKKLFCFISVLLVAFCIVGCSPRKDDYVDIGVETMNLEIGNYSFEIDLENNATAQALVELLPLDINMSELNGNEKYYYLDSNLPTNAQKVGQINAGDVMLYGRNCLVIFYKSFSSGYSYTKIGHIKDTSNLQNAVGTGSVFVKWSI